MYHNQVNLCLNSVKDFSILKKDINASNAVQFYQLTYLLKMDWLRQRVEDVLITKILNPSNCCKLYLESIKVSPYPRNFAVQSGEAVQGLRGFNSAPLRDTGWIRGGFFVLGWVASGLLQNPLLIRQPLHTWRDNCGALNWEVYQSQGRPALIGRREPFEGLEQFNWRREDQKKRGRGKEIRRRKEVGRWRREKERRRVQSSRRTGQDSAYWKEEIRFNASWCWR